MYDKFKELKSQRATKALIGITETCFHRLLEVFGVAYPKNQAERQQQGQIKRLPNSGLQGVLDSLEKRLFFILFDLKVYCTFDVRGLLFQFSPGHAHDYVKALLPVIERSLVKLGLPRHTVPDPQLIRQLLEQAEGVLIDGVEVPCVRPQQDEPQRAHLTERQRAENRVHATIRVAVEHAIGGMKAFHCLTQRIRNHLTSLREYFFSLAAGLWNLKLDCKTAG